MILPVRNAMLLAIGTGGASEDFDQAATDDVALWEGRADATHSEETLTAATDAPGTSSGAAFDERVIARLTFDGSLARVRPGNTVTYEHDGETHTRKVANVTKPDVLGVVRVTLEAA